MHSDDATFMSFTMSSSDISHDESMRKQQRHLLLGSFLGEQEKICSHILYDVAGVGDGTIMVQKGYSLALDDLELLPLWKELLLYSSIMGGVFDNDHVKKWGYELAGAYLHRPTALSLWSLDLLM